MKKHIEQFEMAFTSGAFNLAQDETQDGARVQREAEQSERDRAESEARQTEIETKTLAEVLQANGDVCADYPSTGNPSGSKQVFCKAELRREYWNLSDYRVGGTLSGPSLLLVPKQFTPTKCKRCRTAIKPGTDFCSPQCERVCAAIAERAHVAKSEWNEVGRELATMPGIQHGSSWSVPDSSMLKALANLSRGER